MDSPRKCCFKCNKEFPATSEYFHRDRTRKNGLYPYCKPCRRALSRQHRKENQFKAAFEQRRRWAKREGISFELVFEDIELPIFCPALGIPISYEHSGRDHSPSIDRLDPNKGYTLENVRIISWRANKIKTDASLEEIRGIADWMEAELLPLKERDPP